jgi:hypothetical protein
MKKDVPLCINFLTKKTPYKGPGADSEEKHEPVSDIDTVAVDTLKALDPNPPIREADIHCCSHLFDGSNRATQIKNEGQFISLATLQEPHIWQRSQVNGLPMSV